MSVSYPRPNSRRVTGAIFEKFGCRSIIIPRARDIINRTQFGVGFWEPGRGIAIDPRTNRVRERAGEGRGAERRLLGPVPVGLRYTRDGTINSNLVSHPIER